MLMHELIAKKRDGLSLTPEEIRWMIAGYTDGSIPDYQMSAMLMAVYLKGMSDSETAELTKTMTESGDTVDLSSVKGIKVDKHSTGGVGDTTTLVLGPMVAACGVPFSKMSGRGLGHTGGTLDKLESISGFNIIMSKEKFIETVNTSGIAVIGQSADLAPADKKLYALRDVTATVDCIPLIAASIMSKKLAAGSDGIVLDVKRGIGAFMKKTEDAIKLAEAMVAIGLRADKSMSAVVSNMDQPLGMAVGNALEVAEAIETLQGKGPEDLLELCLVLGSYMLMHAKAASDLEDARIKLENTIKDGSALEKLRGMIENQGGDSSCVDDLSKLPSASDKTDVRSEKDGYIRSIDALGIGRAAMLLGAGRATKEDEIDPAVGVMLAKKIGDKVRRGDVLATLHHNGNKGLKESSELSLNSFEIKDEKDKDYKLIWSVVDADGIREL